MRGRLILLAIVGAASATAVTAAVISAMPRTPASFEGSVVAQTSTQMPGVALDEKDATVQRFLGYENMPSPEPEPEPSPPLTPRYRGGDRGSSNTGQSGSGERGISEVESVTETPAPSEPSPEPSSPAPSPTPSPTPTDDSSTPGGATPTPLPDEPKLTAPDTPAAVPTEELRPAH